ncbi:MAG: sugar ABC transporter substrate-binding protein [Proteobacteria bacterium]|nr:sugar ABC transporter substrate-binding protein [Pseudomonadota bacterium]
MNGPMHRATLKVLIAPRIWAAFAVPALVIALGMGAARAQTSGAKLMPESCKQANPLIGVALPNTSNPYYIAMRQSFLDHGKTAGFKMAVAIADNSDSHQLSQIDAFIQQKVCAVALNAVDSGPGAAMATALSKAGIPVFTVNVSVDDKDLKAQGGQIVQYVGPDQVEGGRVMGEATLASLGKDAKIVAGIVGDPEQLPTNERDSGFKQALSSDSNAEVTRVVNGLVEPDVSLKVAMEMLQGNPNMNVIFADTGPGAVGAIQAIKALRRADKVSLFAFCAADTKLDGPYKGCAAQQPATYAKIVVQSIRDYLDGKDVKSSILLPVAVFKAGETPPPGELG